MTIEQFEYLYSWEQDKLINEYISKNDPYAFAPTDKEKWNKFLNFLSSKPERP